MSGRSEIQLYSTHSKNILLWARLLSYGISKNESVICPSGSLQCNKLEERISRLQQNDLCYNRNMYKMQWLMAQWRKLVLCWIRKDNLSRWFDTWADWGRMSCTWLGNKVGRTFPCRRNRMSRCLEPRVSNSLQFFL